jgi:RimJ/RimL family protein N-acetyltransferase
MVTGAAISGHGLALRVPVRTDRQRWLELYRDPEELRYGVPTVVTLPQDVGELDVHVDRSCEHFENGQPGTLVVAALEDVDTFLGVVAWRYDVPPALRVADIGYAVHPDARRRGVATGAVRLITRWLTEDQDGPGLVRVQLDHSIENTASCRTALRAGFEREGIRRGFLPLRDPDAPDGERRHDVCLHGYLP